MPCQYVDAYSDQIVLFCNFTNVVAAIAAGFGHKKTMADIEWSWLLPANRFFDLENDMGSSHN